MKHVGVGMVCLTPVVQGCCSRLFLGSLLDECSIFSSSCKRVCSCCLTACEIAAILIAAGAYELAAVYPKNPIQARRPALKLTGLKDTRHICICAFDGECKPCDRRAVGRHSMPVVALRRHVGCMLEPHMHAYAAALLFKCACYTTDCLLAFVRTFISSTYAHIHTYQIFLRALQSFTRQTYLST